MQISYKRTATQSHMIIEGDSALEGYKSRMIEENAIDGLLKFSRVTKDGKSQFWYDISGKKSLRDYFEQEGIRKDSLYNLFYGIKRNADTINQYLLRIEDIMISVDTIFLEYESGAWKTYLCYCPVFHDPYSLQLRSVTEHIIQNVVADNSEDVKLCYEIYEASLKNDTSIEMLTDMCRPKETNESGLLDIEAYVNQEYEEPEMFEEDFSFFEEEEEGETSWIERISKVFSRSKEASSNKEKSKKPKDKSNKKKIIESTDFSVDELVEEPVEVVYDEETTYLFQKDIYSLRLAYKGKLDIDDIVVESTPFHIGSKAKGNDYVLDLPIVSRNHAKIEKSAEGYVIEDLNSKNGTFVNGEILSYHERASLKPGDRVSFADIMFLVI